MYAQSFGSPYGSFPQQQSYGYTVQPGYPRYQQQQPAFQRNFGYSGYSTYPQYNYTNRSCNTCQVPKAVPAPCQAPKPVQPKPVVFKPCEAPPPAPAPCQAPPPPAPAPAPCAGGCTNEGTLPPYVSKVEQAIRSSNQPIKANELDIIEINGIRGIWLNKAEVESWKGEIPLSDYTINDDTDPELVRLKYDGCVERIQNLAIKYLKPPKPPTPGPIIIKQEANYPTAPAPPIIIRQVPDIPCNPPPVVIREKPPTPPEPICPKTVTVPGVRLAPPPRRVIIERLAPQPPEAQPVTVERWLPYDKRERKVILEPKPCDPCVEKPKNVVIEWESPCVNPRTELKDLGVEDADPVTYAQQHGNALVNASSLPQFALDAKPPAPLDGVVEVDLTGDIDGLRLVNLEKEGLSQYKKYVR